jgi:MFS transporter, DHA1 family, multidrug resistance protein
MTLSAGTGSDPAAPGSQPSSGLLRNPTFVAALVVAVVVALGFGLVIPVLPLFARSFGVGLFAVTLVVSVFAGVRLVSNVYAGVLADRFGTARVLATGAFIVALSSLLTAGAPTFWALVVLRGFGGLGSAMFMNSLMALLVRTVAPHQRGRAMGLLQGSFLFGIAVGPGVGGLLAEPLGLRWPFVIYAGACAVAGAVALSLLGRAEAGEASRRGAASVEVASGADEEPVLAAPAPASPRGVVALARTAREFSRDSAFLAALVMMIASRWSAAGVRFSLIPVFGQEQIGASPRIVGLALTIAAVTHLLLVYPAGKIVDTAGRRALGAPAYLLFAVIATGVAFATSVPAFLVMMGLYGMGTGLTAVTPPAVVADVVPPEQAGLGVGILNTASDVGSVLGPLISGALAQAFGYGWGFGSAGLMLALAALAALRMRETLPSRVAASAPGLH